MKLTIALLSFAILFGCSGEGSSGEDKSNQFVNESTNKESRGEGIFGKKEEKNYVISSPLEGVLVSDGKPLANTKIIRRLRWNGNEEGIFDEFVTDDNGYFDIPIHEEFLALGKLTEFVGTITLYVDSINDDNFFYHTSKRSAEIYSDIKEPLLELVCDMAQEEALVDISRVGIYSRCKWKGL